MYKHPIWDSVRFSSVFKAKRLNFCVKSDTDAAMNILLALIILTATFNFSTPAPADYLQEYELSMLNKLHKPWFTPDKPAEYPRKGEYPCRGGICKTKVVNECEDCQYAKPLRL